MVQEVNKVRENEDAEVRDPVEPADAHPTAAQDKVPATAEAPATDPDLAEDPAEDPASEAPSAPPKAPAEDAEFPTHPDDAGFLQLPKLLEMSLLRSAPPLLLRYLLRILFLERSLLRPRLLPYLLRPRTR